MFIFIQPWTSDCPTENNTNKWDARHLRKDWSVVNLWWHLNKPLFMCRQCFRQLLRAREFCRGRCICISRRQTALCNFLLKAEVGSQDFIIHRTYLKPASVHTHTLALASSLPHSFISCMHLDKCINNLAADIVGAYPSLNLLSLPL